MTDTPLPTPRNLRAVRIGLVCVVLVAGVIAQRFGVFEQFAEPARLKQTLVELGPWGYVAFLVAYTCLQPFGVPGTVFVFAAPLIWPWPVAFTLSMIGTMSASVVGFSFARFVARDWVSKLIPARFKKYEDALERRGLATVFTLRFIFWMPPLLHAFFGISKVRFWTHFWGSLAAYFLPLLLVSFFGEKLLDALRGAPVSVWIAIGAGVVTVAIGVLVRKRLKRR
jgi:uncharacterized membrane protein YdjX (TVP38/TMEM64 family)